LSWPGIDVVGALVVDVESSSLPGRLGVVVESSGTVAPGRLGVVVEDVEVELSSPPALPGAVADGLEVESSGTVAPGRLSVVVEDVEVEVSSAPPLPGAVAYGLEVESSGTVAPEELDVVVDVLCATVPSFPGGVVVCWSNGQALELRITGSLALHGVVCATGPATYTQASNVPRNMAGSHGSF
jgi:hypothetical protein